jgi:hypothetical protein
MYIDYLIMDVVLDDVLIKRMLYLANKFPDYQVIFDVYHFNNNNFTLKLREMNIDFKTFYCFQGDLLCIAMNTSKTETLWFGSGIEKTQPKKFNVINNEKDLLRLLFAQCQPFPKSLIIDNYIEFMKELIDAIYVDHDPINIELKTTKKRSRTEINSLTTEEYEEIHYDITTITTKKIKL